MAIRPIPSGFPSSPTTLSVSTSYTKQLPHSSQANSRRSSCATLKSTFRRPLVVFFVTSITPRFSRPGHPITCSFPSSAPSAIVRPSELNDTDLMVPTNEHFSAALATDGAGAFRAGNASASDRSILTTLNPPSALVTTSALPEGCSFIRYGTSAVSLPRLYFATSPERPPACAGSRWMTTTLSRRRVECVSGRGARGSERCPNGNSGNSIRRNFTHLFSIPMFPPPHVYPNPSENSIAYSGAPYFLASRRLIVT